MTREAGESPSKSIRDGIEPVDTTHGPWNVTALIFRKHSEAQGNRRDPFSKLGGWKNRMVESNEVHQQLCEAVRTSAFVRPLWWTFAPPDQHGL
jgi:hypothetical protein